MGQMTEAELGELEGERKELDALTKEYRKALKEWDSIIAGSVTGHKIYGRVKGIADQIEKAEVRIARLLDREVTAA